MEDGLHLNITYFFKLCIFTALYGVLKTGVMTDG